MNSTTTPEPVQIPASAGAALPPKPTGWWRRNVWWLLGIAVLGTWAIYAPYREALSAYRERHPSYPVHAGKGEWTAFEGARWRLVGAEALISRDPRLLGPLRKDAGVLLVRFEVIPDSGTKTAALDACRGAVTDAQGRRWEANPSRLPRLGGPKLPNTCGSGYDAQYKQILAVPGRPFAFQHAYLLPRGQQLDGLHARIEFANSQTAKGRYLDFAL
ncbi:hypothetical protein [Lysobacter sp. CA199]|uniref:hypothetical protein n=1 Tax=Lysobacter sp. CA199 TaxID=3455608 RepID=UPI003F8CF2D9